MKLFIPSAIHALIAFAFLLPLNSCQRSSAIESSFPYVNMRPGTAYVGSNSCRPCHEDIFESFMQTGMGRSLYRINPENFPEDFTKKNSHRDIKSGFTYTMVRENDSFYQVESRADDSAHSVRKKIEYVVGSGNHVRSYVTEVNGFLFEMPVSWYARKKVWDLSPGYHAYNQRFSRVIVEECMNCHNSLTPALAGSMNRYQLPIAEGIGCERCHGPGELHVNARNADHEKKMGHNDSTIVNPEHLGRQESLDVCQQCHIPGKMRVTRSGKSEHDFRPGMKLSDIKSIYVDQATDEKAFRITSHSERLALSKCFMKSEMTCVTCHNPHVSVYETPMSLFNSSCIECHSPEYFVSKKLSHSHKKIDNCVSCHMKQGGTLDIPHVEFTDHWIRRQIPLVTKLYSEMLTNASESDSHRISLKAWTDAKDSESQIRLGIAYYKYYFNKHSLSVYLQLAMSNLKSGLSEYSNSVQGNFYYGLCFLEAGKYDSAENALMKVRALDSGFTDLFYSLGLVADKQNSPARAIEYFKRDTERIKNDPNMLFNIALAYDRLGNKFIAMDYYEKIIALQPDYLEAYLNLALLNYTHLQNYAEAEKLYKKAGLIDPSNYDVYFNLGNVYARKSEWAQARNNYEKAIAINPGGFDAISNLVRVFAHLEDHLNVKKYAMKGLQLRDDSYLRAILKNK